MKEVENQLQCQALCEADIGCLGISYSYDTTHGYENECYICKGDDLVDGGVSGLGFYRKIVGKTFLRSIEI